MPIIFLCIGVLLLLFGYGNYRSTQQFLKIARPAIGKVVNMHDVYDSDSHSYTYAPVVQYTDNTGKERTFTSTTSSNPPDYAVGDSIHILYDPAHPENPSLAGWMDLYIGVLILGIIGGLFVIIPGVVLYFYFKRKQEIQWLKENGKTVIAKVNGVELNTSLKVNGQSPYLIKSQWLDTVTNTMHIFNSENIWYDPTQYVKDEIEVLIDPNNPKLYYVKTDFLPAAV